MKLNAPREKTSTVDDERVIDIQVLPPPEALIRLFPIEGGPTEDFVRVSRNTIRSVLRRDDRRFLVVVGPCSVHDPVSAMEYARRLQVERQRHAETLEIVMRVYGPAGVHLVERRALVFRVRLGGRDIDLTLAEFNRLVQSGRVKCHAQPGMQESV